jgi:glycerol-3-phosphate acyltransferase PlsY
MIMATLIITTCVAYILGSIPSGFLLARLNGIQDIREHGSGNIGATNVARLLGIKYFFLVFFCDFFKAFAYLFLLSWYDFSQMHLALAAIALLVGNGFPLFLSFKGGKGVATSFGVLSVLQPYLLLYAFICWLSVFLISKTVGVASVITLILIPLCSVFMVQDVSWMGLFVFFLSLWGLFLHRNNIKNFYCSSVRK